MPNSINAVTITKSLTPEAAKITREFGWDFFKAGVLVVDEWPISSDYFEKGLAPTFLLVREAKVKQIQPDGSKRWALSDQGKWNLPCGRLQLGESFETAALREGREETGYDLELGELCHIGHRADPDNPYVIFIYAATPKKFIERPNPEEIAGVNWFSHKEIIELRDQGLLRNATLTMSAVERYLQYLRQPSGLVMTYPAK